MMCSALPYSWVRVENFLFISGGLPGIPGRTGPRQPIIPRPRYDLIGPNPDHELDIDPGMGPLRPPGPRLGGRNNPFGGGGFGPRFF